MNTKQLTTALMAIILLGGTIVFAEDFVDKIDKTYDTMYKIDRTVSTTSKTEYFNPETSLLSKQIRHSNRLGNILHKIDNLKLNN